MYYFAVDVFASENESQPYKLVIGKNRRKRDRKKSTDRREIPIPIRFDLFLHGRARFTTAQNDEHGCRSKNVKNVFSHSD